MKKFKARQTYLLLSLLLSILFITGCGGGGQTGHWLPAESDTTVPTVTLTVPANGATGVAINTKITATFSEAMDPSTLTNLTFTVKQGATAVPGAVIYSGVTAVFTPVSPLASSTTYTATITAGATDLAGNQLSGNQAPFPAASNYVWSFTTGAAPDTTRPTVTFTVPANGAAGVLTNTKITATFSEAMDPLTITNLTFTVKQGTTVIPGAVIYSGVTAVFTPVSPLAASTTYTATITTGATDLAGNQLAGNQAPLPAASNYVWSFATGAAPDTTRPTVIFTVPANGATGVLTNTKISATFSEAMDPLTISTATFTLMQGATVIPGAVIYSGVTAVFTPLSPLAASTTYTAMITTGATDLAGNQLSGNQAPFPAASNYVWSFTTGAVPDTTRPTVIRTFPANLATNVALNLSQVTATFSEAMDPLTITTTTFTLTAPGLVWSTTVTYFGVTAFLRPYVDLAPNTTYTATITTAATDLAGNQLSGNQAPFPAASNYIWSFTTGAAAIPPVPPGACVSGPLPLGSAATFGVLAGTALTITNPTSVTGDVGSPSITPAVGPSTLIGTKYDTASGSLPLIATAVSDMETGIGCAVSRSCDFNYGAAKDFGGNILLPGVHCVTGAMSVGSNLTLSTPGVYVFRSTGALTTAPTVTVAFGGPANAANTSVFWVSSGAGAGASIGATNTFLGTIMVGLPGAATLGANTTLLNGRVLSSSAVTLDTNTIAIP